MKITIIAVLLSMGLAAALPAADVTGSSSALGIGVRRHIDHSAFEELPYGDNDFSVGFAYEYHEKNACWQLAVDYTPSVEGTNTVEHVITPAANLIFKDAFWRGGMGVLMSYIKDEEQGKNWTDLYWQFLLGVEIPLFMLKLDLHCYYVFDQWGELGEFAFGDLEYGLWLSYNF